MSATISKFLLRTPKLTCILIPNICKSQYTYIRTGHRLYSSVEKPTPPPKTTLQQKLKNAVTQYGSTVIVFHVGISLVSLGVCYMLVSSGLDVALLMDKVGIKGETANKVAANAGTFAVAYAVHKVFAPVRIGVTLTAAPFIVRYLRSRGILKKNIK